METSVEKFDPASLMQGVRDRIKSTFVSLIPDAQWEEMVKAEIDKFLKSDRWENPKSPFQKVVEEVIHEKLKEKVKLLIEEKYVSTMWENGQYKPTEAIEKAIVAATPQILGDIIARAVQSVVNNIPRQF